MRRGTLDQMLLRPVSLPLQLLGSEFVLRRLGRLTEGLVIFAYGVHLSGMSWTPAKLVYLPVVVLGTTAFFGGLYVAGSTICFWTVQSVEVVNILTYGGSEMLSYPMHIYGDWLRRFFTFIIPAALVTYYPALYFLGKPDPFGLPAFMPFLSPVAGAGVLLAAFNISSMHMNSIIALRRIMKPTMPTLKSSALSVRG